MSNRTLAKTKNQNSTTFSPIFGKKLPIQTFTPQSANEARDVSNHEFGHNFGDIQVESPSFKQSCPLALSGPAHCPFGGACHTCRPTIQTKLKISQPNDKYEQEADRIAEQVMRMPDPRSQLTEQAYSNAQSNNIQRKCTNCEEEEEEEEEEIQRKPLVPKITPLIRRQTDEEEKEEPIPEEEKDEEEEFVQAKQEPGQSLGVTPKLTSNIQSLRGGGKPLSESTRAFFESRFRYDFSRVRIHSGEQAVQLTRSVNAKAFTVGRDLFFGVGQYSPHSVVGKKLMAHELTHVIQQEKPASTNAVGLSRNNSPVHADRPSEKSGDASGLGITSLSIQSTSMTILRLAHVAQECEKNAYNYINFGYHQAKDMAKKAVDQVKANQIRPLNVNDLLKEFFGSRHPKDISKIEENFAKIKAGLEEEYLYHCHGGGYWNQDCTPGTQAYVLGGPDVDADDGKDGDIAMCVNNVGGKLTYKGFARAILHEQFHRKTDRWEHPANCHHPNGECSVTKGCSVNEDRGVKNPDSYGCLASLL